MREAPKMSPSLHLSHHHNYIRFSIFLTHLAVSAVSFVIITLSHKPSLCLSPGFIIVFTFYTGNTHTHTHPYLTSLIFLGDRSADCDTVMKRRVSADHPAVFEGQAPFILLTIADYLLYYLALVRLLSCFSRSDC